MAVFWLWEWNVYTHIIYAYGDLVCANTFRSCTTASQWHDPDPLLWDADAVSSAVVGQLRTRWKRYAGTTNMRYHRTYRECARARVRAWETCGGAAPTAAAAESANANCCESAANTTQWCARAPSGAALSLRGASCMHVAAPTTYWRQIRKNSIQLSDIPGWIPI